MDRCSPWPCWWSLFGRSGKHDVLMLNQLVLLLVFP